jgi:transcriptional regulator with XRE-family HTH domain
MNKRSPTRMDKHVGSKIRVRRQVLGISQRKLARALGVSFQQIEKYENGTDRIGAGRLQQLSQALRAPPAFFSRRSERIGWPLTRNICPSYEIPRHSRRHCSNQSVPAPRREASLAYCRSRSDAQRSWKII